MNKFITTILILFIATVSYAQTYTVERVIDGITLKLTNGEEVQLIGIKAPEDEKMGQEATEFVKGLIKEGQEVRLEFDVQERDKYGRLLAYIFIDLADGYLKVPDGHEHVLNQDMYAHFINATIIKSGYATPMTIPPNVKYADLFKKLYEEAREQKRGLWQNSKDLDRVGEGEYCSDMIQCADIDCAKYNSPIKDHWTSDCVNNKCKCMCYGCE